MIFSANLNMIMMMFKVKHDVEMTYLVTKVNLFNNYIKIFKNRSIFKEFLIWKITAN